ncbi:MAG: glutaminyl-peptide cyclotransferase [Candidatus Bathyarchaeia archaeon]
MKKLRKRGIAIIIVALGVGTALLFLLASLPGQTAKHYTYRVVNTYPHDENAFTQGLAYEDGVLYEGTGLYGHSSLRRVSLENGSILQLYALPSEFFGEGITIVGNKIIQLTWTSHVGFVYDKSSFVLLQNFSYPTEGWGITYNGSHLIMSDGTSTLHVLDATNFTEVGTLEVSENGQPVTRLNELEYVKGEIYANIWMEEKIAIINPLTGQVTGWIDLHGIENLEGKDYNDVLNGIAYDAENDRLFVTGKRWPHLFEIKLLPEE